LGPILHVYDFQNVQSKLSKLKGSASSRISTES